MMFGVTWNLELIIGLNTIYHMGTFPDRQHYFAAAGENRDIGSLSRGPFFIGRILFFADP